MQPPLTFFFFFDARYLHLLDDAGLAGDDAAPLEAAPARRLHLDHRPLDREAAFPAQSGARAGHATLAADAAGLRQARSVGHGPAGSGKFSVPIRINRLTSIGVFHCAGFNRK